jgi:hypothetical protein
MHRRGAVTWAILVRAIFVWAFLWLTGCSSEPATGPGEVVWDRDTCERCSMAIGDRRFAAQVRDAHDDRLRRFDDVGCALLWLAEREEPPGESRPEIWVRDWDGTNWIDGHTTRFGTGFQTPMGYGFAAVDGDPPGSTDLAEIRGRLLAREHERRSVGR